MTPPPGAGQPVEPAELTEPTEGGLVPIDAASAATATLPAHSSKPSGPGDIIDPLMLGPQPLPKPKVKHDEIAVVCYLCKTRMYAPLSKVGGTIQCPDCHSLNEVKAPKAPPEKRRTGPTLDDAPNYGLGDPGVRPAYRPIVAPRGEYSALAEFDPAQRPAGWSHPDAEAAETRGPPTPAAAAPSAAAGAAPAESAPAHSAPAHSAPAEPAYGRVADEDDEDVEITIAAPVERLEIKPEIKPLPPPDPDDLYDGKYDDGLIGDHVDRSSPEAWKKAPLVIGILGFLFYSSTLPRIVLYSLGLIVAVNITHTAIRFGGSDDPSEQVLAIMCAGFSVVSLFFWIVAFASALLAVVQETANGGDDVQGYPDWDFFQWIATAAYFPAAAFVAGLPGSFFTVAMVSIGLNPIWGAFAAGAPPIITWIALFPVVLFSMLAEGSIMSPYSAATLRSVQQASDAWVYFYMYAMLIGIFGSICLAMTFIPYLIANLFGCIGLVVLGILYCRILGRLMWYSSEKMAKQERLEERRAAARA